MRARLRKPRRLRLTVVKGFRKQEIEAVAKRDFAAGSNVVTDGLSCWTAVEQAGCDHFPMATGSGPQAARWAPFKGVNTTLGNIKTALAGTYLVATRPADGRPLDPVARFHLGNGATIERINPQGNLSATGIAQSAGMMVNYRYEIGPDDR